jgi:hypothetical protein
MRPPLETVCACPLALRGCPSIAMQLQLVQALLIGHGAVTLSCSAVPCPTHFNTQGHHSTHRSVAIAYEHKA